jgi:predicted AlkP superfamily pyrophosphatase or phosphodiesterase
MAISAIKEEKLGRGLTTDFLAISYSSTDYIGHAFGPYSLEIEDCYYRLDQDIERLLKTIDEQTAGQYWVFLTADHGVQDVPDFSIKNGVPGGRLSEEKLAKKINSLLEAKFGGSKPVIGIENEQIYLQNPAMADSAATFLNSLSSEEFEGLAGFYATEHLASAPIVKSIREMYIDGYQRNRSGQIATMLRPNWMTHPGKGTSHSSPYSHDIHVPFLFYGLGVKPSSSSSPYKITDIAPTVSYLMGILHPNGSTGTPIKELEYLIQMKR